MASEGPALATAHAAPEMVVQAPSSAEPASVALALGSPGLLHADLGSRVRTLESVQRTVGNRVAGRLVADAAAWLPPGGQDSPRTRSQLIAASYRHAIQRQIRGRTVAREATKPQAGGPQAAAGTVPGAPRSGAPGVQAPTTAAALSNARFTKIPRLRAIAAGKGALASSDPRPAVKAVQQALLDLGYSLLKHHTDGRFGGETKDAIRQFRIDHRLAPDGGLDAAALLELDRLAPAAGVAQEHYVDYDRLFADNQLDVTLAIGHDDPAAGSSRAGLHEQNIKDAHAWLADQRFEQVSGKAGEQASSPTEQWRAVRRLTYPTGSGERVSREITINFQLVLPRPGAAAAFGESLNKSELAIYAGHARQGVGPDFDSDKSAAENFVLGVHSALHAAGRAVAPTTVAQNHYVLDGVNDLEKMTKAGQFDAERYRIWFFNACSTIAYMDELRGGLLPAGMDRKNLDVFGTTAPPAHFPVLSRTSLAMLEGILNAETMEAILRRMDRVGLEAMLGMGFSQKAIRKVFPVARPYFREGAGDNPVAPPAPSPSP